MFHCPGCEQTHSVPTRGAQGWYWNGLFDSPSLSPSISSVGCHSFVTDGRIRFLADCEHALNWLLLNISITEWLRSQTGLPVDFQIQPQTFANERHSKARHPVGMRMAKPEPPQ